MKCCVVSALAFLSSAAGAPTEQCSVDVPGCASATHAGQVLLQVTRDVAKLQSTCMAKENNQNIEDATCQPCAAGRTWWPCNTPYCDCSGVPATTTEAPGACVALANNQNIDARTCEPCAQGQTWWPCNTPYCDCSGAPTTTAATGTIAAPTTAPATTPSSSSTTAEATVPPSTSVSPAPGPPGSCAFATSDLASWFTEQLFDDFFPNINNAACTGKDFFNWCALLEAAAAFPAFANSGDVSQDMTELAAFLAHTSHETTGGWPTAPGGPQAWGYCFKEEVGCGAGSCTQYCKAGNPCAPQGFDCTCAPGQTYHGRGPVQLSWNYNYAYFSEVYLNDASLLLNDPSLLTSDPVLAYKAAIWFWMTPQAPKPSCHAVMTGQWTPSSSDVAAGRIAGFGLTTNIINGGLECNIPTDVRVQDRVDYFERYSGILGVSMPDDSTLYCDQMAAYV